MKATCSLAIECDTKTTSFSVTLDTGLLTLRHPLRPPFITKYILVREFRHINRVKQFAHELENCSIIFAYKDWDKLNYAKTTFPRKMYWKLEFLYVFFVSCVCRSVQTVQTRPFYSSASHFIVCISSSLWFFSPVYSHLSGGMSELGFCI